MILTSDHTATALAVGDDRILETEGRSRQSSIADTDLAIAELAKGARGAARGSDLEAAAVTAANEGASAGGESSNSNEVLHGCERVRGTRSLVNDGRQHSGKKDCLNEGRRCDSGCSNIQIQEAIDVY